MRSVKIIGLAAAGALALSAGSASAAVNLLTNGSFEDTGTAVQQGWGGYTYGAGYSLPLPGWTVDDGSVDITVNAPSPSGLWGPAADGVNSLDINGWNAGTISQTVTTTPGATYLVSFFYSRNAAGAPDPATAEVSAGGVTLDVSAANDGSFGGPFAMLWKPAHFTFTGTGSDTLTLKATVDGNGGVFFDGVSVTGSVPEPASWALMIGGFGLAGVALRRRRVALASA